LSQESAIQRVHAFIKEADKILYGKEHEIKLVLCCLLARGHLLLEDGPGMGKTILAKATARLLNLELSRIQFTSDLLPADITGTEIFDATQGAFRFHPGPLFSSLVLADELNRASPKTQSACLEAMEEHQVTIDGKTHQLAEPFHVLATQNPRFSVGTYPLPRSELDRFLMRLHLGYPAESFEKKLLLHGDTSVDLASLKPVYTQEELKTDQNRLKDIYADPKVIDYIYRILQSSRKLSVGLSPRAGLALMRAARAWAFMAERQFVIPEDVQAVAQAVLAHRLEAEEFADASALVTSLL
jgi:MoxR-like ATPase